MAKILIVEDEKNIASLIQDTLHLGNYETKCIFDGETAVKELKENQYDLLILDIMLPKLNGFEVVEKIQNTKIPVIFLSAKDDVATVVKGLKSGAQDYMTKPFEPLELLARIELRLQSKENEKILKYKQIEVNIEERMIYKQDGKIELTPKEYELFLLLLQNLDKALTREEILDKVWGIQVEVETRTVDYHIQQLRRKLDLRNDIITVNKIGYRLEKRE